MKLGVSITAFREKNIVPIIKQYEGVVDRIVVTVGKAPWKGGHMADDTARRAVEQTGAIVISKEWVTEQDQRNEAMDLLRDMDYVITSHCDTWFTQSDLQKLKNTEGLLDLHYTAEVLTYWKDYETIIYPHIGLPTLIVRSDAVFTHYIDIAGQLAEPFGLPITCYHTSWVKTDEEVLEKIQSYSHADEIVQNWYNDIWLGWKPHMQNFGPTKPEDFQSTKKKLLPKEIQAWLEYS